MYKKKKIFAIITARGGSKSIPNKNIKKINGKPLVYYSIKTGLASKLIDRVIMSTDSKKIMSVGKKYNCETPFLRPRKFSGDKSTDLEVFNHLADWLKKNDELPSYFVHLRPTHPIRDINEIDKAIKSIVKKPDYDSLRSLSVSKETPFKMWIKKKNQVIPILKFKKLREYHSAPRQLLPVTYWQNGYVDIIKVDTIIKLKSMVGKKVMPFLVRKESRDIDYKDELKFINKNFFKIKYSKKKVFKRPS